MTKKIKWKDANEEKDFLELLNRKGFALEDKAQSLLYSNLKDVTATLRNKTFRDANNVRIEIDVIAITKNFLCICECKRTIYSWLFPFPENKKMK